MAKPSFSVDQWREWYADATKTDPDTMEQLVWLCGELHEVVCKHGHLPGCHDPAPALDDWNGWVDVLAARRARFWWMTVGAAIRESGEAPALADLDAFHTGHVPPDTTGHLRRM